jgi:cytochrome c oxidase subunit 4
MESNVQNNRSHDAKHAHEFKHHMWSYFASITLTIFAFLAVHYKVVEIPLALAMFIVLLAVVQVVFQLFIWMHMNQKGHEMPIFFIGGGVFVAIITVAALMLMIYV